MAKWPWRSKSMTPIFNTSQEILKMHIWCIFGDSSSNLLQVIPQANLISYNSEAKWPKSSWWSRLMTHFFQHQHRISRDACLVQIWWFLPNLCWVIVRTSQISENCVKMAKMTSKITVNDPYFQYQLRISQDTCLVQIWWFQFKSVTSYRADKVKFRDWQTDIFSEFVLSYNTIKQAAPHTCTCFYFLVFCLLHIE